MLIKGFTLENIYVGDSGKPCIIAEIGQAHDGSLGLAHAYIDAVADAGADAIKFQTHIASEESTLDESFRIQFSLQDDTRFHYWKRMEFTAEQWIGLAAHARKRQLIFLSSPFSIAAVHLLAPISMPAWKVGSGEVFNEMLLDEIARNRAPIILSTGMSTYQEIHECVEKIKSQGLAFALLQCTSQYPAPLEKVGLNVLDELRRRFHCPVGLSDHSGTIFPGLMALARGAHILEVHVVFDRRMFGPDVSSSITIDELRFLVQARDAFGTIENNPVNKDDISIELSSMKTIFTKSIATKMVLEAGTIITEGMLTLKKPGTGIQASELTKLIGRRLKRRVFPDRLLKWEDTDG